MPRIKLLLLITRSEIGGAQEYVYSLATRLPRDRYEVVVACGHGRWLADRLSSAGVRVVLLSGLTRSVVPVQDARALVQVWQLIRRERFDIVHLNSSKAGFIGRLVAASAGVPSVFTAHGWGFKPGVPFIRRWTVWASEFLVSRLSAKIICVSNHDRQLAQKYGIGHGSLLTTIHNGLPDQTGMAAADRFPVKIMMTARFQEPKDHTLLLHAFAKLKAPSTCLILAGGGPQMPAAQLLAAELGISERVAFLGDRTDVPALLADSQIFVLLSRYEGLPISILEAMRAGLPLVASDVGGIREEVEHGVTGFLIPRRDAQAVTDALQRLVDDPQLRKSMGQAGRAMFLRQFTLERMLAQTEQVYHQVLGIEPAPNDM